MNYVLTCFQLTWKQSVSNNVIRYSTVVRKSPLIDNSFRAITRFLLQKRKKNHFIIIQNKSHYKERMPTIYKRIKLNVQTMVVHNAQHISVH